MPRLLDLFCGEGGAGMGYARAGWSVTGVDAHGACGKRYPFPFVHGDALEYLAAHGAEYDAIHASPPCQLYSVAMAGNHGARAKHPDLVDPTRDLLKRSGRPWVMENVPGAPLHHCLTLCGSMFGLRAVDVDGTPLVLRRHRLFETADLIMAPSQCRHGRGEIVGGVYGGGSVDRSRARFVRRGGYTPTVSVQRVLMGIDWMTRRGLMQAIPPDYTEWIGSQLLDVASRDNPAPEPLAFP